MIKILENINESLIEYSLNDLRDWLSYHDQAAEDIENFYNKSLYRLTSEEIWDWLDDHEQLRNDIINHFTVNNLSESYIKESNDFDYDNWNEYYYIVDDSEFADTMGLSDISELYTELHDEILNDYDVEHAGWLIAELPYAILLGDHSLDCVELVKEKGTNKQFPAYISGHRLYNAMYDIENLLANEENNTIDDQIELANIERDLLNYDIDEEEAYDLLYQLYDKHEWYGGLSAEKLAQDALNDMLDNM